MDWLFFIILKGFVSLVLIIIVGCGLEGFNLTEEQKEKLKTFIQIFGILALSWTVVSFLFFILGLLFTKGF